MTQPWTLLTAIVGLGLVYVLVPVFLQTFLRFRSPKRLACPVTGGRAAVRVDASRAAFTDALVGRPRLRVGDCSLWPERSGCAQGCLTRLR